MLPVLTATQMREADRRTIEEIGLPGTVLMENAGAAVAWAIRQRHPSVRRPVVLCGKGNNGGDGFVVARRLLELGPRAYLIGARADVKGDARLHMGVYERSGGEVVEVPDAAAWEKARDEALAADVVVDALLGTGLSQEPTGLVRTVISDLAVRAAGRLVVAVDIPSGIASDSGEVPGAAVTASLTVAFAAPKYGHVLPPACDRIGEMVVADIGIPRDVLRGTGVSLWLLEAGDAARAYAPRAPGSHKGTYGHVLVVAGAVGKTGAAILAATAALRSGTGLVTVATPQPALPMVAAGRAEMMTEPLPVSPSGGLDRGAVERALALAKVRDAVVLGPGLGQGTASRDFIREFVARCPTPLVVDADGLNALAPAGRGSGPAGGPGSGATGILRREAATIVTPHPGEMARLIGSMTPEVQRRRLETARAFAVETGALVVLKGQRTVVAGADGRAAVNPTGNPGMATGGTGDVLAGMIGALLARGCDAWTAATASVYLHGVAGDRAAARLGPESMVAGDLLEALPEAVRYVTIPDA